MPYWRAFYHIVWGTKHRLTIITPEIEALAYPVMAEKARESGAIVYALNGTTDHVHLVAAIPPRIAVGQFVGQVKGRSSYVITHQIDPDFAWQAGYGLHTFAEKHLPGIIHYVQRQKEHHASDDLRLALEMRQDDNNGPHALLPDSS